MMSQVTLQVHSAELEASSGQQRSSLFCLAEIEHFGRLSTPPSTVAASDDGGVRFVAWEESLSFTVGPTDRAQHLKLVLKAPAQGGHSEYVAAGSLGLDPLLEGSTSSGREERQHISVPVVDEVGKHAGQVSCTLCVSSLPADQGEH